MSASQGCFQSWERSWCSSRCYSWRVGRSSKELLLLIPSPPSPSLLQLRLKMSRPPFNNLAGGRMSGGAILATSGSIAAIGMRCLRCLENACTRQKHTLPYTAAELNTLCNKLMDHVVSKSISDTQDGRQLFRGAQCDIGVSTNKSKYTTTYQCFFTTGCIMSKRSALYFQWGMVIIFPL